MGPFYLLSAALLLCSSGVGSIKYLEVPKETTAKIGVSDNKVELAKSPDTKIADKHDKVAIEVNDRAKRTLFGASSATSNSTFKALGSSGTRKYDADNAITRGGGYWCSEGNVEQDREIYWTAELRGTRVLTGITILWVYAPQMVSISTKRQKNDQFEEVVPFQAVDPTETTQSISFKKKVEAQYVKVTMKGQINGYFGIEFVQFHGEPNPVFRIQSGITSIEDMCLQVDESGEVVLESCISAIAGFKFNDIWRYNEKRQIYNPVSMLCMTLQDDVDTEGGKIVMLPCDKYTSGNSWDLLPNNQIKLRRPGNICLSQAGSHAGLANVALNKIASSSLSRKNDPAYNAERALDGNLQSYWASEHFTAETVPEKVEFVVDLQDYYKVRKIEIEWESPALVYNVLYRKDNEEWELLRKVRANTLNKTVDEAHNKVMRFIKLELIRPNPEYMNSAGQIFYGIKSFSVLSLRLRTIVEPCAQAKLSKDARDKYFLESVYEVDLHSGDTLKAAETAIDSLVEHMERKIAHIENLNGKMQQCKQRQINALKRAQELERSFERVSNEVYRFEADMGLQGNYMPDEQTPSDCIEIKNRGENNPTGFYYIHPPCAEKKVRVYCDMYTGSSYYVAHMETSHVGLSDVYSTCRSYGLDPFHMQHESQIEALKIMLKTTDTHGDNLFPIAVKVGNNFKSLDLENDVTPMMDYKTDAENNIVAIGSEGTQYVDGRKTDFSGVICSSNYSSVRLPPDVIKLGCQTLIQEHDAIKDAPMGTVLSVTCPKDCAHNDDDSMDVEGGNDGLYSTRTPICMAAIHSAEYKKNATYDLQKVSAPVEFEGFFQNGIQSTSAPAMVGEIAFKITRKRNECAPKKIEPIVDRNAVEKHSTQPEISINSFKDRINTNVRLFNQGSKLDAATGEAIGELVTQVNQQSVKASPMFLDLFNHHFSETVSGALQLIKIADIQRQPLEVILDKLDDGIVSLQNKLQWLAARVSYKKGSLIDGIKALQSESSMQDSFEPWSSYDVTNSNLFDLFRSVTVGTVKGVPKWSVSELALRGSPETVISQTSEFTVQGPISGALLYLNSANYYDFIYSSSVYAGGSGSFGLAFRIVDENNYYLFQMIQVNGGYKRLVRVVNGEPFEIAKIEDGGFIEGVLYTVRIEARQCRISVSIVQGVDPVFDVPSRSIDIIDCYHTSGSVGLYSGQINLVHFARLHVETLPCIRYDKPPLPPKPPICSIYNESYVAGFNSNWRVLDNSGAWNFENDVGGEYKVIAHRGFQAIDGSVEPSIAVLKGGRSCKAGIFRASLFPQCDPSGVMGMIVHFSDAGNYVSFECSGRSCKIVQMHKGTRSILAETSMSGLTVSSWNMVELIFKRDSITASLGTKTLQTLFINTAFSEDLQAPGTVGLYSLGCAGCAFSNISLTPNYSAGYKGPVGNGATGMTARDDQCMAIDRLEHCKTIAPGKVNTCEANYCTYCCEKANPEAPALQDLCYSRCRDLDHSVVLLQKTVEQFWRGCASSLLDTGKEKLKDGEPDIHESDRVGDCELCCESSLFVEGVSVQINKAAKARCLKLCSS